MLLVSLCLSRIQCSVFVAVRDVSASSTCGINFS